MLEEVRATVEKEMDGSAALEKIGRYVLDELLTSEENAEKIGAEKKSLKFCFKDIRDNARKQAVNGCAVVDDATVYDWVRKYYGIQDAGKKHVSLLDLI